MRCSLYVLPCVSLFHRINVIGLNREHKKDFATWALVLPFERDAWVSGLGYRPETTLVRNQTVKYYVNIHTSEGQTGSSLLLSLQ